MCKNDYRVKFVHLRTRDNTFTDDDQKNDKVSYVLLLIVNVSQDERSIYNTSEKTRELIFFLVEMDLTAQLIAISSIHCVQKNIKITVQYKYDE